jgi:hypothetical protein
MHIFEPLVLWLLITSIFSIPPANARGSNSLALVGLTEFVLFIATHLAQSSQKIKRREGLYWQHQRDGDIWLVADLPL